ncbi:cytochrome P450 9e2-like [Sitophilus oryzae]|uniref:Cytochrome P450 9e2-like n=1 Tax=Sitophilus oryzae TaxID=7048 RepID=A0A6J2Y6W8_SITOR|nr:cytochrome P450 9e2-like [Sitophilus oryzae]
MLFFLVFFVIVYVFYQTFIKPAKYWNNKGVEHINLWRRFLSVFLSKKSFLVLIREAYNFYPNTRYYGSFQFLKPSLMVTDLELIKKITTKDFDHFHDHPSISNKNVDTVLTQNLFSLEGHKWREMRSTLSPAFTSSKMRHMFDLMVQVAQNFTNFYIEQYKDSAVLELEMKEACSRYTNDVIASCAFGIEVNSLEDRENEFFRMGNVFAASFRGRNALRGLILGFFPLLGQILKISIFPQFVTDFFKKIVSDTIAFREKNHITRPDMIHLLMQARTGELQEENTNENAGFATVEEIEKEKRFSQKVELADNVIAAQALAFFFAGFETSATVLSFISYELAIKPEIQKKLHQEIDETLLKNSGKLDYEAVLKMKYLDQVISEVLRLYPPAFAISRVCTKNYVIDKKLENEEDFLIEKGCIVVVPIFGLHMDPNYFPNPDDFDPERFNEENKHKIVPGTYMPFGMGPRNCIGSRFALLEIKALVVSFLSQFSLEPVKKTEIPITFSKTAILSTKNGIWIGLKKR